MKRLIDIDRFTGEADEPPVWGNCAYCGAAIYEGQRYSEHGGLNICDSCKHRYAYSLFEEDAVPQTAKGGDGYE